MHRRYERLIALHPYHELTDRERRALTAHLEKCERCRKLLDSNRKMHLLLDSVPAPVIRESVIREAHLEGLAAVRAIGHRSRFLESLKGVLAPHAVPRWAYAAGSLVILAGAFFAGRLSSSSPVDQIPPDGNVRVTNIRLSGDGDRAVEAAFDLVKHVQVRGSIDDPQVQKLLASALVDAENPGVRLRAANGVASVGTLPADRTIRAALILAAKTDRNDAVRKEALMALMRYPADREIRDVLLEVLTHDPNAALRIAAINGLDSLRAQGFGPDASQVRAYRKRAEKEQNLYVRVKTQSILGEVEQ